MDKARSTWLAIHGWLGAVAAAFMLLIGLTGSALVFIDDIMEWQLGDAMVSTSKGAWAQPATLEQAAIARAGSGFVPLQTYYPDTIIKMPVAMVYGQGGKYAASSDQEILVFADPVTAKPTGVIGLDDVWADTLLHFHVQLLAGTFGSILISICGVILMISALSGIYLWWPKNGGFRRKLFQLRLAGNLRAKALVLHHFVGIYFAGLIFILGFSGAQLSQPHWFSFLVPYEQANLPASAKANRGCANRQPDAMQTAAAAAQHPGRTLALHTPGSAAAPALLQLKAPDDADQFYGDFYIWLDCKGVLATKDHGAASIADAVSLAQYSLHSGRTFGIFGPVLIFLSGLVLALLSLSGLYLFIKRRWSSAAKRNAEGQSS
ncbi:MAG: PepSY-associated TM helix domain-containing protein [Sphingorhabdus sp.]